MQNKSTAAKAYNKVKVIKKKEHKREKKKAQRAEEERKQKLIEDAREKKMIKLLKVMMKASTDDLNGEKWNI